MLKVSSRFIHLSESLSSNKELNANGRKDNAEASAQEMAEAAKKSEEEADRAVAEAKAAAGMMDEIAQVPTAKQ